MAAHKAPLPVHYARVACEGYDGPCSWANVFYFEINELAPDFTEMINNLGETMHYFYNDVFTPAAFSANFALTTVRVLYRDTEDSVQRATIADSVIGTSAGGVQCGQVSYLVNWSTSDPRKGGKPRNYISGVADAHIADSARLDPTVVAGINGRIPNWFEEMGSLTVSPSLVDMSFRNNNTWRDAAVPFAIDRGSLSPIVATQRRRIDRLR